MAGAPLPLLPEDVDGQEVVVANVRALMGRYRVSQTRLAEEIGLSTRGMSDRLNGHVNLTVRELGAIARFFGKDMVDLVTVGKLAVVQGGRSSDTDDPQQKLPFLRSLP